MNPRIHLLTALALPLAICQLAVTAQCDTLDFEGFPSDSPFTDQYQSCGVVFSSNGVLAPPVTYDYGSTSWTSVLHSYDWYGELRMDFVDPLDGVTPAPVSHVSFDNPIDTEIDYIVGAAYDVNGIALLTINSVSPDVVILNSGAPNMAYIILDDAQGSAYIIDNLVFTGAAQAVVAEHALTNLTVIPTLADELITVRTSNGQPAELLLIAPDGRIVQRINATGTTTTMDVRQLAAGTYTVLCNSGASARTARFVKL